MERTSREIYAHSRRPKSALVRASRRCLARTRIPTPLHVHGNKSVSWVNSRGSRIPRRRRRDRPKASAGERSEGARETEERFVNENGHQTIPVCLRHESPPRCLPRQPAGPQQTLSKAPPGSVSRCVVAIRPAHTSRKEAPTAMIYRLGVPERRKSASPTREKIHSLARTSARYFVALSVSLTSHDRPPCVRYKMQSAAVSARDGTPSDTCFRRRGSARGFLRGIFECTFCRDAVCRIRREEKEGSRGKLKGAEKPSSRVSVYDPPIQSTSGLNRAPSLQFLDKGVARFRRLDE